MTEKCTKEHNTTFLGFKDKLHCSNLPAVSTLLICYFIYNQPTQSVNSTEQIIIIVKDGHSGSDLLGQYTWPVPEPKLIGKTLGSPQVPNCLVKKLYWPSGSKLVKHLIDPRVLTTRLKNLTGPQGPNCLYLRYTWPLPGFKLLDWDTWITDEFLPSETLRSLLENTVLYIEVLEITL